jgi:hypothetical protein
MESSFKKGYDKTVNADGSIAISLEGKVRGAAKSTGHPLLLIIIFVVCAVFTFNIAEKISPRIVLGFFVAWTCLSVGSWFIIYLIFKSLTTKKTSLVIKPNEGVIFDGNQLPFADIQKIGINHQTTNSNLDGNAQVFASSHGNNINITGWLPLALAEAVADEIKKSSGVSWA